MAYQPISFLIAAFWFLKCLLLFYFIVNFMVIVVRSSTSRLCPSQLARLFGINGLFAMSEFAPKLCRRNQRKSHLSLNSKMYVRNLSHEEGWFFFWRSVLNMLRIVLIQSVINNRKLVSRSSIELDLIKKIQPSCDQGSSCSIKVLFLKPLNTC